MAARLWGSSETMLEALGIQLAQPPRAMKEYRQALASARSALGAERFDALSENGKALTLEQSPDLALQEGWENHEST